MEIDRYERWFMTATFLMICGAIAALVISVVGHQASLATPAGRVVPSEIDSTPPFDDPGLHQTGPGEYELVLVAQTWSWTPNEVHVPAGSTVTILATSRDVIHGIRIRDTNANVMVIPGQISEVKDVSFDEPGTYWLFCHEYCGIGHQGMSARIIVDE
ncbi:MAG: cytochrome C oxidase subunit II [Actinomyces sp.]|nr:MAG: cytochrome C oxidase subunit II [Actinomyces sp.]